MKQKILELLKKPKNLKISRRMAILIAIPVVILVAVAWFFVHFSIREITVLGNSRYSDAEIIQRVCTGTFSKNTLIVSRRTGSFSPEDLAFVDQIDVSMQNSHSLLITVQERQLAGYVEYLDCDIYFDDEGVVVDTKVKDEAEDTEASEDTDETTTDDTATGDETEAAAAGDDTQDTASADETGNAAENTTSAANDTAAEGDLLTAEAIDESDETQAEASASSEIAETSASDVSETTQTAAAGITAEDQATYEEALAEAPLVEGLDFDAVVTGEVLPVKDTSVFNTIQSISRMISKYNIRPDLVAFDEDMNITLEYEGVTVNLGPDTLLEEKLTRMAAIMKKLGRRKGTIHLEDYDGSTENIIFTESEEDEETSDTSLSEEETTDESTASGTVSHDAALVTKNENIIHLKKTTAGTSALSETQESQTSDTGVASSTVNGTEQTTNGQTTTDQTQTTTTDQTATGDQTQTTTTGDQTQTTTTTGDQTTGTNNQTTNDQTQTTTNNQNTTGNTSGQTGQSSGGVQIDKPVLNNLQ